MKTFILLSAIPGSGKSTWARQYQRKHDNTFIVSSDDIREELFGAPDDFRNERLVWDTYLRRINEYAALHENVTVIADATNLQNAYRRMYHDLTPRFDKHIFVLLKIPFETCLIRNQMRDPRRIVPHEAMERLRDEFEEPTIEIISMYDEYEVITDFLLN